ncbi:hypothetical protein CgunFtcFv8_014282 [Champsocephalus gunnari]|uniref:Uncharacterized protein n=1 Tax=Champsocephalus gunnari TaxID=52237 RepID=A0AAN8HZ59_CHAGU|nr:hypothetical protein CgunFtcFv8_014282 [Champsocephalus gunnari]
MIRTCKVQIISADLLYGVTGLSILLPWPQVKRRVHLVLVRAQLHAAGPPASPGGGGVGSASDCPLGPLQGSFHSSTPLRHAAT